MPVCVKTEEKWPSQCRQDFFPASQDSHHMHGMSKERNGQASADQGFYTVSQDTHHVHGRS